MIPLSPMALKLNLNDKKNRKFILTALHNKNVPKYTTAERELIKTIVSILTIKRIPDSDIKDEIQRQTGKSINRKSLWHIRQQIKHESLKWYSQLRQGEYEYIHEFKERINEIMDLQRRHYLIIEDNPNNPAIQQTSLAELHKLSITLSNLYDVAPTIVNPVKQNQNDNTVSISQKDIIV
jgi:hypothetical protein